MSHSAGTLIILAAFVWNLAFMVPGSILIQEHVYNLI